MSTAIQINSDILTEDEIRFLNPIGTEKDFAMLVNAVAKAPTVADFWKGVRDDYYPDPCYLTSEMVESDIDVFFGEDVLGETTREEVGDGVWGCVDEVPSSIVEKIKAAINA